MSSCCLTKSDTIRPVHSQKARNLNFRSKKKKDHSIGEAKTSAIFTNAIFGFAVSAQLKCVLCLPEAKSLFSHDAAQFHLVNCGLSKIGGLLNKLSLTVFSTT